jgi:uncharacterized protein
LKELVKSTVQAIVDHPDEVEIHEIRILEVRVAHQDRGQLIGKGGSHVEALRTILAAASYGKEADYELEIAEE